MLNTLIATTDRIQRKVCSMFFSKYGTCRSVENGEEAIRAYKESVESNKKFQLVCADSMLPGICGVEFIQAIRTLETYDSDSDSGTTSKVIILSLIGEYNHIYTSEDDMDYEYLLKPIRYNELEEKLKHLKLIC